MATESKRNLGLNIDSRRDWRVLCRVFCLLICTTLIVDIYLSGYGSDDSIAMNTGNPVKLNRSKLTEVISTWRTKEVNFNQILKEKPVMVDPSL
ncbi:MAG: hypothetical protein Q7S19_01300 [bacterium]|nr:hypothetical protein [bacterium]